MKNITRYIIKNKADKKAKREGKKSKLDKNSIKKLIISYKDWNIIYKEFDENIKPHQKDYLLCKLYE